MSQATAVRAPARPTAVPAPRGRGAARPASAGLRVVAVPATTRSRAGLVLGCLGLLALGLIGLLVLNVGLERGAYDLRAQRLQTTQLREQREALQEEVLRSQAPAALAASAKELGMVPAPNTAFVRQQDGRVLGVPSPAVAPRAPSVATTAGSTPAASASPAPTPSPSVKVTTQPTSTAGSTKSAATRTTTSAATSTTKSAATSTTKTATKSATTKAPATTAKASASATSR